MIQPLRLRQGVSPITNVYKYNKSDDLFNRGIIKHSQSPYCARVVPVRKKSGQLRLCVDLSPLNEQIIKQKYPFPLIENCLARLGNKFVFILLDLKDGFI